MAKAGKSRRYSASKGILGESISDEGHMANYKDFAIDQAQPIDPLKAHMNIGRTGAPHAIPYSLHGLGRSFLLTLAREGLMAKAGKSRRYSASKGILGEGISDEGHMANYKDFAIDQAQPIDPLKAHMCK
uniref:Uncharacterized protein n=1 Tax=Oryza punctata TaxID=4537 RepID=A0A0E0JXS2_ORYPU